MKKLVTISVFLAIVVAFAAFELWYDAGNYQKLSEGLQSLQIVLEENEQNISVTEVENEYDKIRKHWDKMSTFSMMMTNHNIIRSVNEKFAYLDGYIKANVYSDALSTTGALIKISEDLRYEKYPGIGNIF